MSPEVKSNSESHPLVLVILGPTASGKTRLAVALASKFNGEIISADSRQVYKGMDVGTGKDLGEYKVGKKKIPHHLIDIVKPNQSFDLAKFQKLAFKAIDKILQKNKLPILVGGSGLYLQAVVDNYDLGTFGSDHKERTRRERLNALELFNEIDRLNPAFAKKINDSDRHNTRRLARYLEIVEQGHVNNQKKESRYSFELIGLNPGREILRQKIEKRLQERLEKEGLIEEVKKLHKQGVSWQRLESFGLEYKFLAHYLQKKIDYDKMFVDLNIAIRQFAKRQLTWFKRWERQGRKIKWFKDAAQAEKRIKVAWRPALKEAILSE